MLQTIISALTYAMSISLMAVSITLLYNTTRVLNFAQASYVILAGYMTFITTLLFNLNPFVTCLLGGLISGLAAVTSFYIVLEPLRRRKSPLTILMIATFGVDMIYVGIINILVDYLQYAYQIPARNAYLGSYNVEIAGISGVFIAYLILNVAVIVALFLLQHTKIGIMLRATMQDERLSKVMGINTTYTLAISWFLAGMITGLSGALTPLWTMLNPTTGYLFIVPMFCASIVGGLDVIYGAFIGALVIGLTEVLGIIALSNIVGSWVLPYRPALPLIVMTFVLMTSPSGITSIKLERLKKLKGWFK